jgi:hypothetical protein
MQVYLTKSMFPEDQMTLDTVKPCIAAKTHVTYRNTPYYITACIMRLQGGEWRYTLELHDLKVNSVTIANIEDIITTTNPAITHLNKGA